VQGVDFHKSVVSLPETKLSYSLIVRKLLGQVGLIGQLRTDEAGKIEIDADQDSFVVAAGD